MMRAGFVIFTFVVALATAGAMPPRAQAQDGDTAHHPYGWTSAQPPEERLSMLVDLREQRAYLYRGGDQIASVPISSGRRHYPTPTGTFTVVQKQKMHRSNKYNDARMPFMQRLSWDGLALHAGGVPRRPSSHGCIHLPRRFASWLYEQPTMGMRVTITDRAEPETPLKDSRSVVAVADTGGGDADTSE
jgi:lipoprotein-anchoring transpeptidase ErfK/SrfK